MSSSSNEGRRFLSADRGSILRLAVVILLGAAALFGPLLGSTSARFSDERQIGVQFAVGGTPTAAPTTPATAPTPEPTAPAPSPTP